jgi:hypothetical protein
MGLIVKLVDRNSATFDIHPSYGMDVTHVMLNKFSDPQDINFRNLVGVVRDFLQGKLSIICHIAHY